MVSPFPSLPDRARSNLVDVSLGSNDAPAGVKQSPSRVGQTGQAASTNGSFAASLAMAVSQRASNSVEEKAKTYADVTGNLPPSPVQTDPKSVTEEPKSLPATEDQAPVNNARFAPRLKFLAQLTEAEDQALNHGASAPPPIYKVPEELPATNEAAGKEVLKVIQGRAKPSADPVMTVPCSPVQTGPGLHTKATKSRPIEKDQPRKSDASDPAPSNNASNHVANLETSPGRINAHSQNLGQPATQVPTITLAAVPVSTDPAGSKLTTAIIQPSAPHGPSAQASPLPAPRDGLDAKQPSVSAAIEADKPDRGNARGQARGTVSHELDLAGSAEPAQAAPHVDLDPKQTIEQDDKPVVDNIAPNLPKIQQILHDPSSNTVSPSDPPARIVDTDRLEQAAVYRKDSAQSELDQPPAVADVVQVFAHNANSADKTNDTPPREAAVAALKALPAPSPPVVAITSTQVVSAAPVATLNNGPAQAAVQPAPAAAQLAEAIAVQSAALEKSGSTTLHLQLDPPGLGVVRMHVSASEQSVSARLVVQEESTRQVLESQVGQLRDRLTEAGVTLGRITITRDGGGSSGQGQQPSYEQMPGWLTKPRNADGPLPAQPSGRQRPRGLIDVIA